MCVHVFMHACVYTKLVIIMYVHGCVLCIILWPSTLLYSDLHYPIFTIRPLKNLGMDGKKIGTLRSEN